MELKLKDRHPRNAAQGRASARGKTARQAQADGSPVKARRRKRLPEALLSIEGLADGGACREDRVENVKLSVIITHHNYSEVVGRAIDSVLTQSHQRLELVIVDDASEASHRRRLERIVAAAGDRRLKLVSLKANVGQTAAMLIGLDQTDADFVCYLDPDDYYAPDFAEKMLRAHLNPRKPASVTACEMGLYKVGGGIVSLSQTGFIDKVTSEGRFEEIQWSLAKFGYSQYFPAMSTGWIWAATSSMVFRRDALEFLRLKGPMEPALRRICGDGYLVYGAHMLGGTLFVHETLSWRGIHSGNAVLPPRYLGGGQQMQKQVWADATAKDFFYTNYDKLLRFVIKTIVNNGAADYFQPSQLGEVISTHLNSRELSQLCAEDEAVRNLMWKYGSNART